MNHINKMPLAVCLKWDALNEPTILCDSHHCGSWLPQMSWVGPGAQRAETEHCPVSRAKRETDGSAVPACWLWGAALGRKPSRYQDELNEDTHSSAPCRALQNTGDWFRYLIPFTCIHNAKGKSARNWIWGKGSEIYACGCLYTHTKHTHILYI